MIGHIVLRLAIWFLLTDNFSLTNAVIGVAIAFLLPRGHIAPESFQHWLKGMGLVLKAFVQAYVEAFEMLFRPHDREEIVMERVRPNRSPGLIFLDIYLITFTPKTIVLKHHEEGWYEVHQVKPGRSA